MELILGNCNNEIKRVLNRVEKPIIVTDPPFNIGYKYNEYQDNLQEAEYYNMLKNILGGYRA